MHGHRTSHSSRRNRDLAIGALILAAGVAAAGYMSRPGRGGAYTPPEDAPFRAWRRNRDGERVVVGRTVTIDRDRNELYAYWRDFSHLPNFMENVRSVTVRDDRHSEWIIAAPASTEVRLVTEITENRPGEIIAWRSTEDSDIAHHGRVLFRDAPAGRGTEVEATIAYDPPAGRAGQTVAKLFQREPKIQARRELKRFKQLMETGEIATAEAGPAAPRA